MAEGQSTIALNKRARFEYHLEERIEAGISLMGWEVKALRAGNINFSESHVLVRRGEAFLFGCLINPLTSASTTGAVETGVATSSTPVGATIGAVDVSRVRATSARVTVTSPACVSVVFTHGPAGGAMTTTDSPSCSSSHTLLLGVVTPRLVPGTTYEVTITATDRSGTVATRRLSFTTQG